MVLYTYSGAPNPRRVHMYLAEKGIEVPFRQVDLLKRENRSPDFLASVNPLGGLPVLEHLARWHASVSARPSARA